MIVRSSRSTIHAALGITSRAYSGNIRFRSFDPIGPVGSDGRARHRLTITVDGGDDGRSVDPIRGRRIAAACWHAHGDFFDVLLELDPGARVSALGRTITVDGGNWEDMKRGSMMYPTRASEWCHCGQLRGRVDVSTVRDREHVS